MGANSLVVHPLGLVTFTAEAWGSIPGLGTKISQAMWRGQKKKKKPKQTNIKTSGDISEMKKTLLEAGEKGDTFYKVAGT